MAAGNCKTMIDINPDYVLGHCHDWCKENNVSIGELGEKLGHSQCYIQSSCRNKKLPPAELNLLGILTNMDIEKAKNLTAAVKKAVLTSDEKLDYIIEMLESMTQ